MFLVAKIKQLAILLKKMKMVMIALKARSVQQFVNQMKSLVLEESMRTVVRNLICVLNNKEIMMETYAQLIVQVSVMKAKFYAKVTLTKEDV